MGLKLPDFTVISNSLARWRSHFCARVCLGNLLPSMGAQKQHNFPYKNSSVSTQLASKYGYWMNSEN
jgi:hypothetical protein